MKFLLLLVVVAIGVWMWRSGRLADRRNRQSRDQPANPGPMDMVCCHQCGVHIPKADAVSGQFGVYCSVQHRLSAEP